MILGIKFQINKSLYSRDPQDTKLGKRILKNSILLINEIGFEAFNFKKLAEKISSAEKSVYRYFENKHLLLLFLTSWYWEWVHYLIQTNIQNVKNPELRLAIAIEKMVFATSYNAANEYIDESVLHNVIIHEGSKSYHTYAVDEENKEGLFLAYKSLCNTLAEIILLVNPEFPYAHSLASNLFEMVNNQVYFAKHLPKLSSLKGNRNLETELVDMMKYFVEGILNCQKG